MLLQSLLPHGSTHSFKRSHFRANQKLKTMLIVKPKTSENLLVNEWVKRQWLSPSLESVTGFNSVRPLEAGRAINKHTVANSSSSYNKWITQSGRIMCALIDFLETRRLKWLKRVGWVTQIHLWQQKPKKKHQLRNRPCKPCIANIFQNDIKETIRKVRQRSQKIPKFKNNFFLMLATWNFFESQLSQLLLALRAHVLLMAFGDDKRVGVNNAGGECERAKWRRAVINSITYRRVAAAAAACQNIFLFNFSKS